MSDETFMCRNSCLVLSHEAEQELSIISLMLEVNRIEGNSPLSANTAGTHIFPFVMAMEVLFLLEREGLASGYSLNTGVFEHVVGGSRDLGYRAWLRKHGVVYSFSRSEGCLVEADDWTRFKRCHGFVRAIQVISPAAILPPLHRTATGGEAGSAGGAGLESGELKTLLLETLKPTFDLMISESRQSDQGNIADWINRSN